MVTKTLNAKSIVQNVELVFRKRDIKKLNGTAYHFITLQMGFIAHYDVHGFRNSYEDLEEFAKRLQTSEYSDDYDYNLRWANTLETQRMREGPEYGRSRANAIRSIVAIARKYYPGRGTGRMFNPTTKSKGVIWATKETVGKYGNRPGVVMFSSMTGEKYSATPGDYFWAPPGHVFKDSKGHPMFLVKQMPETVRALKSNPKWQQRAPFGPRFRTFDGRTYELDFVSNNKASAEGHASAQRSSGKKARVTRDAYGEYLVWVCLRSGEGRSNPADQMRIIGGKQFLRCATVSTLEEANEIKNDWEIKRGALVKITHGGKKRFVVWVYGARKIANPRDPIVQSFVGRGLMYWSTLSQSWVTSNIVRIRKVVAAAGPWPELYEVLLRDGYKFRASSDQLARKIMESQPNWTGARSW